ncbi:MAG: molybdate ABC transporter substrate-binding protein [Alteromonadaceae bacterium]|nr:molybdate ABC transporter substrate-binding protein [Alteromonadaceae bacterium]|tara:strand:+ start:1658 stop:2419 length:762 start_codon:yes stop_codon:yes gene_type:complete
MNQVMQYVWAFIVVVCAIPMAHAAPSINVAVAANFAAPLQKLLPEFEAASGIKVRVSVGSSGALFAQIQHGAPYDLFLSADSKRPQALVASGRVTVSAVQTYAVGHLALVGNINGLSDPQLMAAGNRVAIAEPDIAPYGRAAKQLLEQAGLWEQLAPRLIRGTNIQQTLQFWQTGNVDVAFIAASQCVSYQLSCQTLPDTYAPIIQQLAVTGQGESAVAAEQLAAFLRSPQIQSQLADAGYAPLTSDFTAGSR